MHISLIPIIFLSHMMATGGNTDGQNSEIVDLQDLCEPHCQPCQDDGVVREAVGLCTDCQDYLCQRCFDSHTIPKPSKHHQLLDKQQMPKPQALPPEHRPDRTQTPVHKHDRSTEPCPHHENQFIEYYCTSHCQLCCSVCLNLAHRTCGDALYIPHIAKDLANNEAYKQAESRLKAVLEKTRKVSEDVKQSAAKIETSFTESMTVVKQFRKIINDVLDNVEANIVEQAEMIKSESLKQLASITERYQRAHTELEAIQARMDALLKSGQICDLYIVMMKTQNKTKALEAQMTTAMTEHFFSKRQIHFSPNTEIPDILKQPEAFGRMSEVGSAFRAEYIGDIYVRTGADRYSCSITGSVILPDTRVVIADNSNACVKVVDVKNGHYITRKKLHSIPWDIAMIDNTLVVVTMPFAKQLAFVSITNTLGIAQTLAVNGNCYGVDFKNDNLAISFCEPNEVQVLTLKGVILYSISTDDLGQEIFNYPLYVTIGMDNAALYVTNNLSRNIVCVRLDGTVVASYTDSQLVDPRKIVLDHSGDLYVCAYGTHSVHHITSDCRKIGELITLMDHGLHLPSSISYSEGQKRLYVAMPDDTVRVYQAILGAE